ncbi:MAG: deoxyguanosinetriphosphate triphosphohydrolase [bacterium]
MDNIREHIEEIEKKELSWAACLSSKSKGRKNPEEPCSIRPAFQHDRDRIVHSKAFRRLGDKTQVFLSPKGSHYSNRLTHTLEVTQIGRTVAKALFLNESLTEAIGLGHDLGHTPFGHSGEKALGRLLKKGFRHEKQSIRVVDLLARNGEGLNLTHEVKNGIVMHSKGQGPLLKKDTLPETLEGQIIRFSDIIAYLNHDIDDAVRGGFLDIKKVPYNDILGERPSYRINMMVTDLISNSFKALNANEKEIRFSSNMVKMIEDLRDFMFLNIYETTEIRKEFEKAEKIIESLFYYFSDNYDKLSEFYSNPVSDDPETNITDFIASLTDSYAIHLYTTLFIPKRLKFPDLKNEE